MGLVLPDLEQHKYRIKLNFFLLALLIYKMSSSSPTAYDEADVAKHAKMAEFWWNPNSLLLKLNTIRVEFMCKALKGDVPRNSDTLKNLKVLDAGCGGGLLSEAIAELGAEVTGVDAGDVLLEVAKNHAKEQPQLKNNMPKYILSSVEEYASTAIEKYDVVVASEILEHVLNHELFLKACCQMIRPGGHLFITTPYKTWRSWWDSIVWMEYIIGVIPRGTHQYDVYISPEDTTNIIRKYNCATKEVRPFGYSHDKRNWEWGKEVWYALHAQKEI